MAAAMKSDQRATSGRGGLAASPAGGGLGATGLGTAGGQRLPSAPRERKPALAALAVLLVLGGALASAYLVMASGQRVSAIRIAQPVAAGQRIPMSALQEVQVGDTGIEYIAWSERAKVAQTYAAVPLVRGALLTNSMVSRTNGAAQGRMIVGLSLKPGQFPAKGLESGKRVGLYAVGGNGGNGNNGGGAARAGTVLAPDAIVIGVSSGGSGRLGSDSVAVDVAVPPNEVAQVTQAASSGLVAVALIPDGTQPQGGDVPPQPGGTPPTGAPDTPNGTGPSRPADKSKHSPGTGGG
ncbi:hypothetical protein [Actinomadura gamaensis]|uniref:SAF domain-containing protein n=1 Tax=Actinomadura gamaensis TaxID=1763541 RepID=A0ABV9U2Y5_9ACTN